MGKGAFPLPLRLAKERKRERERQREMSLVSVLSYLSAVQARPPCRGRAHCTTVTALQEQPRWQFIPYPILVIVPLYASFACSATRHNEASPFLMADGLSFVCLILIPFIVMHLYCHHPVPSCFVSANSFFNAPPKRSGARQRAG